MRFELPFPPSLNRLYRSVRGRSILSAVGRAYHADGAAALMVQRVRPLGSEARLSMTLTLHAPDHRRRDLDNFVKVLADVLTHNGIYGDDSQIDRLTLVRGEVRPRQGCVIVELEPL